MVCPQPARAARPGRPACPLIALRPRSIAYPSDHTTAICSPSRVWSDLFWLSLNAQALRSALGGLRILEIGCGDGRYAEFYERAFGPLESYSGIDPKPRDSWKKAGPRRSFIEATAEQLGPEILGASNLIVSQSAIEHIPDDVGLFRTIGRWAAAEARPVVQCHVLPGANMWRQYGLHGFSGYSGRALQQLIATAPEASAALCLLGSRESLQVHYRFISDLRSGSRHDRRAADTPAYTQALLTAIDRDLRRPPRSLGEACFPALILVHNSLLQAADLVLQQSPE